MYAAEIEKQACTEYGPDRGNLKFAMIKLPWLVQEYNARRQAVLTQFTDHICI